MIILNTQILKRAKLKSCSSPSPQSKQSAAHAHWVRAAVPPSSPRAVSPRGPEDAAPVTSTAWGGAAERSLGPGPLNVDKALQGAE